MRDKFSNHIKFPGCAAASLDKDGNECIRKRRSNSIPASFLIPAVALNTHRKNMLKFLAKNRHNTVVIEKLRKQDRDTNEEFERVKRLRQELGVSRQSSSAYEPQQRLHTLKKDHQPNQLKNMLEKQALVFERRKGIKSLVYDIVEEALVAVDDLFLDESPLGGMHNQVTNTIVLDDSKTTRKATKPAFRADHD